MTKTQRAGLGFALVCLLSAGLLLLSGCNGFRREGGPQLSEPGRVVDLPYVPAGHGSGSGTGFSTSGDITFSSSSIDIPARYAIVFECQHGRFVVENQPELWKSLHVGEEVDIHYYEILEGDDSTPMHAVDLKFIGATARGVEKASGAGLDTPWGHR